MTIAEPLASTPSRNRIADRGGSGFREEVGERYAKCLCDPDEGRERRVGVAALDVLPVLGVEPGAFGRLLLSEFTVETKFAYPFAEPDLCLRNAGR